MSLFSVKILSRIYFLIFAISIDHQNLQLDWAAHPDEFIQHSIKISNYWMTTTEFSTILKGLNGNRNEFFENGSKVIFMN